MPSTPTSDRYAATRARVRQSDIQRLIRAVRAEGESIAGLSVAPDGSVLAHLGRQNGVRSLNEWDEVLTDAQEKRPPAKRH